MKILLKHKTYFATALLAFTIYGCIKEEDLSFDKVTTNEWSPEWAVPLIHSGLSIKDLTGMSDSGMFTTNSNHQISLVYNTNIYKIHGYEFFTPVNQSSWQTLQLLQPDSVDLYQNDSVSRSINLVVPLTFPNGEQIDSLNFRKGSLRINLTSYIPHDGILKITIPSATLGGQQFSKSVPISASTGAAVYTQDIFDMSGYNMGTKNLGMSNQLRVNYSLTFLKSQTTLNTLNKNFDITTSFDSITPSSLFGFLGQREFIIPPDSSEISILNNFQGGGIYLDDPKMTISLTNSFGMPIDASINTLSAIQTNGTVVPIVGPYPSPLIDYPIIFGQTATNSFVFDNTNSNIKQAINSTAHYFTYDISAGTNSPLPTYNFMSDSSIFKADLKIEFPLKGYTTGFTIQDTVNFGIGEIKEIASAAFRLNISNGFPIHARAQLYFTDNNYNILDSLFTNSQDRIIESAEIDSDGIVTSPTVRSADEVFDGIRLQHLFDAKKILVKGVIDTKDAPTTMVQILDTYKLDFKLGVRTKLKITF